MEKINMSQIIGSMSVSLMIVEISLSTMLDVYGENIPANVIQELLEEVIKRTKKHNEQWENRV